jgi:tetratricopeptide (TPR) repeat protein
MLVFNSVNHSTCQRARHGRTLLFFAVAVVVAFTCACEKSGPVTDAEAEQEINYQRARKLCEASDFQAAAEFYKRALLVNAAFAKAHLELGLLCDDKLGDPISAIYHYRRYLELKPDSDKKQLVEDFIERAKLSFAAKLPQSSNMDSSELTRLQNEKAALLQENAMLRTRLAELEQAAQAVVPKAAPVVTPQPMTPPVTAVAAPLMETPPETGPAETSGARIHVVKQGETLYSLALQYYGTRAAWEKIYQANRNGLPNRDQLKVGQSLVIP